MIKKNNNKSSINEIFQKAQTVFLENPLNEEAKRLFIKSYVTKILKEEENKFDLFGFVPDPITDLEKNLKSSTLIQRSVVDPPFGLKAALCLGEVTEFQREIISLIENEGLSEETMKILNIHDEPSPYTREKGQIDTGSEESKKKIGDLKLKYSGALKDFGKLSWGQKETLKPVALRLNREELEDIKQKASLVWIPFDRSKAANAISASGFKGSISPVGAGELEFLARMYYAAEKKMNTTIQIPSSIQMQSGVSRELAEEQETFLLNLGNNKGKIADRCKSILETYMILAVEKILQPILKFQNVQDYAYEGVQKAIRKLIGIDEVSDQISEGKYDFDYANIGAWTYTVVKNYAIDQLKGYTNLVFDTSKAAEFAAALTYPYSVISKIPTDKAKGLFDNSEKKEDKRTGKIYFVYTYNNKESFFEDLKTANGFAYEKEDSDNEAKVGRKTLYDPQNPLYFKNLSDTFRGNFMTSIQRYLPSGKEYSDEEQSTEIDSDLLKKQALTLVDKIKNDLLNISNDIIDKIAKEPAADDKYGHGSVKSFLLSNKELASSIILRILGYGIYKFVEKESIKEKRKRERDIKSVKEVAPIKGTYDWMTAPETYLDDFIVTLQDNQNLGQGLPSEVTNKKGVTMPIKQFVQLLRKVVLGSGTEGKDLEKFFKTGKEGSEEFKKTIKSKGFLLLNPSYLRKIYSLLKQVPSESLMESKKDINKVKKLIEDLKVDFDNFNNKLYNQIL